MTKILESRGYAQRKVYFDTHGHENLRSYEIGVQLYIKPCAL